MIPMNGVQLPGVLGGRLRRYPGGTENASIFGKRPAVDPKPTRRFFRRLRPLTRTAKIEPDA